MCGGLKQFNCSRFYIFSYLFYPMVVLLPLTFVLSIVVVAVVVVFHGIFVVHCTVWFPYLLREDTFLPCSRTICKGLVLRFH